MIVLVAWYHGELLKQFRYLSKSLLQKHEKGRECVINDELSVLTASLTFKGGCVKIIVSTMEDLCMEYGVDNVYKEGEVVRPTTYVINEICQEVTRIHSQNNTVNTHVFMDEVYPRHPDEKIPDISSVIGHMPCIVGDTVYSWSELKPGSCKLIVSVKPRLYLEHELYRQ